MDGRCLLGDTETECEIVDELTRRVRLDALPTQIACDDLALAQESGTTAALQVRQQANEAAERAVGSSPGWR